MEIAGIALQVVAGIILGLPYILPDAFFDKTSAFIDKVLFLPLSKAQRRYQAALLLAIISPAVLLYFTVVQESNGARPWYETVFGITLGICLSGMLYMTLLKRFSDTRWYRRLLGDDRYRILLITNILLVLLFAGFSVLSYFGITLLMGYTCFETSWQIFFSMCVFLLVMLLATSSLAAFMAFVFILIVMLLKLLAIMAQPIKKPLWTIVLFLYFIGGILLIVNAVQSV